MLVWTGWAGPPSGLFIVTRASDLATGSSEVETVKAGAEKLTPEELILAALSPEQRLEPAFRVAREAFRGTTLTVDDVEEAVRTVRRKRVATRGTKATRRR
ncbi:hypothetical protein KF840_02050 [bacterium]|nr:hypothetical protein [bacterium]